MGILNSQVLKESPGVIAGATAAVPSDERQEKVSEPQPGGLTAERGYWRRGKTVHDATV